MTVRLGVFTQGEIPAPVVYQFLDSEGAPIDLTGYTIRFTYKERHASTGTDNPAVLTDAVNGEVTYTWTDTDLTSPGDYRGQFWAGDNEFRHASVLIEWCVRAALVPVPDI